MKLEQAAKKEELTQLEREVALIHVANILGRPFIEIMAVHKKLSTASEPERFLKIIYWLGKLAIEEETTGNKRAITFSPMLRERLGHHIHGERWANRIKETLKENGLMKRPIHIISANMHSVMNSLFAQKGIVQIVARKIKIGDI